MWPLAKIQQYIAEMAKRQNPLATYDDTLRYLVGGQPAVIQGDLGAGTYGLYRPSVPDYGRMKDTIVLAPQPNDLNVPRDFIYGHEMGHRLYYDNESIDPFPVVRSGPSSPLLQEIVKSLHKRNLKYDNEDEGEGFAQAFGQAMQTVRGRPYTPPKATGVADTSDVRRFEEWIRRRLAQRSLR